jgi:serine/threonine protein kinase
VAVASLLHHKNIVACYGAGELKEGELFIAMELCTGGSLRDWIHKGMLKGPAEMLKAAHHTAKAIQYLHSLSLIHRDIKSMNVLMSGNGEVKVADFGTSATEAENNLLTGSFICVVSSLILLGLNQFFFFFLLFLQRIWERWRGWLLNSSLEDHTTKKWTCIPLRLVHFNSFQLFLSAHTDD